MKFGFNTPFQKMQRERFLASFNELAAKSSSCGCPSEEEIAPSGISKPAERRSPRRNQGEFNNKQMKEMDFEETGVFEGPSPLIKKSDLHGQKVQKTQSRESKGASSGLPTTIGRVPRNYHQPSGLGEQFIGTAYTPSVKPPGSTRTAPPITVTSIGGDDDIFFRPQDDFYRGPSPEHGGYDYCLKYGNIYSTWVQVYDETLNQSPIYDKPVLYPDPPENPNIIRWKIIMRIPTVTKYCEIKYRYCCGGFFGLDCYYEWTWSEDPETNNGHKCRIETHLGPPTIDSEGIIDVRGAWDIVQSGINNFLQTVFSVAPMTNPMDILVGMGQATTQAAGNVIGTELGNRIVTYTEERLLGMEQEEEEEEEDQGRPRQNGNGDDAQ
ncbi:MAG: hypothetical protein NUW37_06435 [Planctomycetes bacterium]|nr:hypothetical protein [Planctomycetota bacterium]